MRTTILALALMSGCCAGQVESRDALLDQIGKNLEEKIGPKFKMYLDADKSRPQDHKDNDYGLVEDSISAIRRVVPKKTETPK